jgi:tetratricopeptide (TPR) repeat protein
MSKRLEVLQKMIDSGKAPDLSFARYAYALELKTLGRLDESLAAFDVLKGHDAAYVAQYLMAGGVAQTLGKLDVARAWFEEGITRAKAKGDGHALSELQQALLAVSTD